MIAVYSAIACRSTDAPLPTTDESTYPASITGDAIFSFHAFPASPIGPYEANTYAEMVNEGLGNYSLIRQQFLFTDGCSNSSDAVEYAV